MKNLFKVILAGVAAIAISFTACAASVGGATLSGSMLAVTSSAGPTNEFTYATNGLYTPMIAPASTETNLVCLNPYPAFGNTLSLQITGSPVLATSSNTMVVVISSSTGLITPSAPSTNATANTSWNTSVSPRSLWGTVTLALGNGANTPCTTNIVVGPTTGYCGGTKLYVETIGMSGASTGNYLTNYSISIQPGQ